MVENDFIKHYGKKFLFFLQKWPQKGCALGPKTPKMFKKIFWTKYLIEKY